MKLTDPEEENIELTISEKDSELVERLKEIISQTSQQLPNPRL